MTYIQHNSPFKKTISEIREEPGQSNAGKYPNVASEDFAGPNGTYPINTIERAKSALKLAHNSPNPGAIKAKVYAKYPELRNSPLQYYNSSPLNQGLTKKEERKVKKVSKKLSKSIKAKSQGFDEESVWNESAHNVHTGNKGAWIKQPTKKSERKYKKSSKKLIKSQETYANLSNAGRIHMMRERELNSSKSIKY